MARAEMTQVVMTNKKIGKKVGKFFQKQTPKPNTISKPFLKLKL